MLRDLLRLGDDFFAQMTVNFLREGPRRIERLRRFLGMGDLDNLATTAHGLASIASTVAAVRLAELCYRLEKLARKRAAAECPGALRRVEEGFDLAARELLDNAASAGDNRGGS
ncbi:MAG: Hpt domain-containing protein, partial [Thermoanaerobaculia bacterium]